MFDATAKKSNKKGSITIGILIGANATVKGDIVFSGGLRVDGKVEGKILANGQDDSAVVLSEHAVITGDVAAAHIVILGTVKGSVHCSERLELYPQARISGDVHYKLIELAPGATVNGNFTPETAKPKLVIDSSASNPKAGKHKQRSPATTS